MGRDFRLSGLIICTFSLLVGCGVQFEAETKVRPDGSLQRVSRFIARSPSDKEDIVEWNVLSEDGTWTEKRWPVFNEAKQAFTEELASVYEIRRRILPTQIPPSDYVRHGNLPMHTSSNAIEVAKQSDGWFFDRYEYRETFHDIGSTEQALEILEILFPEAINAFCISVQERWDGSVDLLMLRKRLVEKYRPILDHLRQEAKTAGFAAGYFRVKSRKEVGEQLEDEAMLTFLTSLGPDLVPGYEDRWTAMVPDALGDMFKILEKRWEELPAETREKAVGLHAVPFRTYRFRLKTNLPGKVIETNATSQSKHELIWDFEATDFFDKPYVAFAKSRSIAYGRVGFVSAAGIVFLLLLLKLLQPSIRFSPR